jgi:hypothetical protein
VSVLVADWLTLLAIDEVSVRYTMWFVNPDINHLQRATEMGRVLCTYDVEYPRLAAQGFQHAGIVFGRRLEHGIEEWCNGLEKIYLHDMDDMRNHVEYL